MKRHIFVTYPPGITPVGVKNSVEGYNTVTSFEMLGDTWHHICDPYIAGTLDDMRKTRLVKYVSMNSLSEDQEKLT